MNNGVQNSCFCQIFFSKTTYSEVISQKDAQIVTCDQRGQNGQSYRVFVFARPKPLMIFNSLGPIYNIKMYSF